MANNRQILVKELPEGQLEERHFEMREVPIPTPGSGEVLTRTIYLSLDPANRAWMRGATYRAPVSAGQVMAGFTMAQVVESRDPSLEPGDIAMRGNFATADSSATAGGRSTPSTRQRRWADSSAEAP